MKHLRSLRAGSSVSRVVAALLLFAPAAPPLRAELLFEFLYTPALDVLPPPTKAAIVASMTETGAKWSSLLTDPVTLKITVDIDPTLPSSVFAAAFAAKVPTLYTSVSGALVGDALSPVDASAVSSLQPGPKLEAITHDTSTTTVPSPEIRLGGATTGIWNSTLSVSRPNLKALGLLAGTDGLPGADGTITLNPTTFMMVDFTREPFITAGLFDFTGIAIHELGHLMGFYSGVDEIDFAGDGAPGNPSDLSDDAIFTVLDLYRYSATSLSKPSQPSTGAVNDWRFGPPPPPISFAPKPYFSVDGGATVIAAFATGMEHGDGDQASHFADGVAALMDPGFPPVFAFDPTPIDVIAMDAMGWDVVPEPTTCGLLLLGIAGTLALHRRRRS